MKKFHALSLCYILIGLLILGILNICFPFDGYYSTVDSACKSENFELYSSEMICSININKTNSVAFFVGTDGMLYQVNIRVKKSLFGEKYRVKANNKYSLAIFETNYENTDDLSWHNVLYFRSNNDKSYLKWDIVKERCDVENSAVNHIDFNYGEERYVLYYELNTGTQGTDLLC